MPHTAGHPIFPPRLDLGDFVLRPLRATDAAAWYAYLRDPLVVEYTSFDIQGLADVEALVAEFRQEYDSGRSCRWAIARQVDEALVGTIGLHDPQAGAMELGYDLARACWGQGLVTRAAREVLRWGFSALGLCRIQATVVEGHTASVRVLEKCGFQKEGVLRDYRLCRGSLRDFGMYALLRRNGTRPAAEARLPS